MPARKPKRLVTGYIEHVSSKVFSDYSNELTGFVAKKHGIYALYKGNHLYYVGLASNLRGRVKQHLRDKHSGKWDKFSVYLVRKVDHIRELEALILRVVDPKGNTQRGRLRDADDLKPILKDKIRKVQASELESLIGKVKYSRSRRIPNARTSTPKRAKGEPPLAGLVSKRFAIRREYKGYLYKAHVLKSGWISFDGGKYRTPSAAAAQIITSRYPNGWTFWRYRNSKGEWVPLKNLR